MFIITGELLFMPNAMVVLYDAVERLTDASRELGYHR